ncbi:hypothetical protein GQ55_6G068600 [Panicum hallii var. hallii]|uniref:Uncharacterized protein n=1 Tax=Panicum hallii var. hallii TaxID=1504633 RepID=A0A2T7D4X1_9POAL|nr:hypothetical protein GQ55_6G068600 [Panicum hallii var. hallii]
MATQRASCPRPGYGRWWLGRPWAAGVKLDGDGTAASTPRRSRGVRGCGAGPRGGGPRRVERWWRVGRGSARGGGEKGREARAAPWCSPWNRLGWRKARGGLSACGLKLRRTSMATGRGGGDSGRQIARTGVESGGVGGGGGGGGYCGENRRGKGCGPRIAAGSGGSSARPELGEERKGNREGNGAEEEGNAGPRNPRPHAVVAYPPVAVRSPAGQQASRHKCYSTREGVACGVPPISHPCVDSELFVY